MFQSYDTATHVHRVPWKYKYIGQNKCRAKGSDEKTK